MNKSKSLHKLHLLTIIYYHYTKTIEKIKHHRHPGIIFWRERVMQMKQRLFFAAGRSNALNIAAEELEKRGVSMAEAPSEDVTHLLLPVPCKMTTEELNAVLDSLPKDVTVLGGFLDRPELAGYRCFDLLADEQYQAKNAMITAYCAINIAAQRMRVTWDQCPVLILGWGRIGKCLGRLLKVLGADVSIAARKETDRAMIAALDYDAEDINNLRYILGRYKVIFNTVPSPILSEEQVSHCRANCLKIELASRPGIVGDDVIDARGLPGKFAPESSGALVARTVLRLCARKEG